MNIIEKIQQYLDEKLIIVNKNAKNGQIIFMSGGAGSGKGFAISNFLDANSYKVRDVDEFKRLYLKLAEKEQSSDVEDNERKYKDIYDLNLIAPEDVGKLHQFVATKRTNKKTLDLLMANNNELPNILFDITGSEKSKLYDLVRTCINIGYLPENIHIIWILKNFEEAKLMNSLRSRVVPDEIMHSTHKGAATVMSDIILRKKLDLSLINGEVYVVLNNNEITKFYRAALPAKPGFEDLQVGWTKEKSNDKPFKAIEDFTYIKVKNRLAPVDSKKYYDTIKLWVNVNAPDQPPLQKKKIKK